MTDGSGFTIRDAGVAAPGNAEPCGTPDPVGTIAPTGVPKRELAIGAVLAAGVRFWRDADSYVFATVPEGGHLARYPVRSRAFKLIVQKLYGQAYVSFGGTDGPRPGAIDDRPLTEAVRQFEALTLNSGDVREPAVRVATFDGATWLDLGTSDWAMVRVSSEGWEVVPSPEKAPLVRPAGLRAMPVPARDPDALAKLRGLLNVADGPEGERDFRLMVAWMVAALHPAGPYPILALDGEQGSGKSTAARMLRTIVDPNLAPHRAPPRKEDDLLLSARNGRVVALDNVSFIEADIADAICRVATGAGFSTRTLYTNTEETIIAVARPVLLNGIPSLLARGDLADRSLAVTLPAIPDDRRRAEAEVWRDFDAAAPGILALLLDGLAQAYRAPVTLAQPPRMADFAHLACSAAPAFGWTAGEMLDALARNRAAAADATVQADALATAVLEVARREVRWTGTASELLAAVNGMVGQDATRERTWPKDGTRMSQRLRRLAPALRRLGVEVSEPTAGGRAGRVWTLTVQSTEKSAFPAFQRSEIVVSGQEAVGRQTLSCPAGGNAAAPAGTLAAFPTNASVPGSERQGMTGDERNAGNAGNADLPISAHAGSGGAILTSETAKETPWQRINDPEAARRYQEAEAIRRSRIGAT